MKFVKSSKSSLNEEMPKSYCVNNIIEFSPKYWTEITNVFTVPQSKEISELDFHIVFVSSCFDHFESLSLLSSCLK